MVKITPKSKMLGPVGGAGSSAKPGAYNQGLGFAASIGRQMFEDMIEQRDVRGGTATPGGYNQGAAFAMSSGKQSGEELFQHKDLRGGNSNPNTGYNQGSTFAASKK